MSNRDLCFDNFISCPVVVCDTPTFWLGLHASRFKTSGAD